MLLLIMNSREGVMILADNLRILGPILSSPVDFLTFKFNKKNSDESLISKGDFEVNLIWYL